VVSVRTLGDLSCEDASGDSHQTRPAGTRRRSVATNRGEIVALLADLVDYPGPELAESVLVCRELVSPAAASLLDGFLADLERLGLERMQELYSSSFELEAACYPYVGHQLLGESYRRSRFMVWLLERYAEQGFEPDRSELPDHLLVMLRFLAVCGDDALASELVGEAILPALGRMTSGDPATYLRLLEAVGLALRDLWPDVEPCTYDPVVEGGLA
jgi:nitrate reductase delta subunit